MRHIRNECINIPHRFCCKWCVSKYRRKEDLLRHLRTKHGPLFLQCQLRRTSALNNQLHFLDDLKRNDAVFDSDGNMTFQ